MNKNITLYEIMDKWLEIYIKPTVKFNTYRTYIYSINHVKKYFKNKNINNIGELEFQELLLILFKNGYSKSTINKVKILLKCVYNVAIRNGYVRNNPAEDLKLPNAPVKKVRALTNQEQEVIENECKNITNGYIAIFLLQTGLRASELMNLKWCDYNSNSCDIIIRQSKTKAGERIVPLTNKANSIILHQDRLNEYIFNSEITKTPITPIILKRLYERIRKYTGISIVTTHTYRHTFVTRLIEKGVDYKALAELIGHTDISFTLKRYTHIEYDFLKKQINLLDN